MATPEDVVLSYSEPESEFSGFDSDDLPQVSKTKNVKNKKKGKQPANPKSSAKAKKSKSKKALSETGSKENQQNENETNFSRLLESMTDEDLMKLRELFGFNDYEYDDEENMQNLFGCSWNDKPNLTVELTADDSDSGELAPAPKKSQPKPLDLSHDLINAMFGEQDINSHPSTSKVDMPQSSDISWDLPILKGPEKGPAISDSLANLINVACTKQCKTDTIISNYKVPSNCDQSCSPIINNEIWKVMSSRAQTYDKCFGDIQNLLAIGLVPMIKLIDLLKPQIAGNEEAQTLLSHMMILFGQVQYNLSLRRRYMIRPNLKRKYQDLCHLSTPITTQLFGDHISHQIKECDTSVSVGKENYGPRFTMGNTGRPFRGKVNFRGNQWRGSRGFARYQPYPQYPQYLPYGQFGQYGQYGQFGGMPFRGNYGMYPRGYPRQRYGSGRGKKQAASATVSSAPNETA